MPAAHSRPPPLFRKQTGPMQPRPPGTGPTAAKSLAASHLQKPEASARNTCRLASRNGPYGNARTAVLPANTTNEGAKPQQGRHYASIVHPGATAAAQWHRAIHTHKKRHGRKRPPQQDRAGNGPSTDKLPCKTQQPWPAQGEGEALRPLTHRHVGYEKCRCHTFISRFSKLIAIKLCAISERHATVRRESVAGYATDETLACGPNGHTRWWQRYRGHLQVQLQRLMLNRYLICPREPCNLLPASFRRPGRGVARCVCDKGAGRHTLPMPRDWYGKKPPHCGKQPLVAWQKRLHNGKKRFARV